MDQSMSPRSAYGRAHSGARLRNDWCRSRSRLYREILILVSVSNRGATGMVTGADPPQAANVDGAWRAVVRKPEPSPAIQAREAQGRGGEGQALPPARQARSRSSRSWNHAIARAAASTRPRFSRRSSGSPGTSARRSSCATWKGEASTRSRTRSVGRSGNSRADWLGRGGGSRAGCPGAAARYPWPSSPPSSLGPRIAASPAP